MSAAESSVAASRALDDLYRAHATEVYRYAYAVLGNHADAEDVTQTTFVNALRALERGERPRKPSNWLITIAHNIVRQRFRQQQARPTEVELDRDVAQQAAESTGPSMDELVRALQRIPQSQREALVMRELEGRSYREIAQILELSTSALETLLFRARRSLADELENAVTCDGAELSLSKQLDGRISRKERKRLDAHISECPSCKHLQRTQTKHRHAFKGLALLPLPVSLTLFKGAPSAGAAIGIPTIGAAGTAAVVSGGAATGGGFTFGGLALGGIAVKAAAVVTAVSVAGGVGYVGTKEVQHRRGPAKKTPVTTVAPTATKPRPASAGGAQRSASAKAKGKALANGSARATSPTGSSRGAGAPGKVAKSLGKPSVSKARTTRPARATGKPQRAKPVAASTSQGQAKSASRPAKAAVKPSSSTGTTGKAKIAPRPKKSAAATAKKSQPNLSASGRQAGNGKKP